MSGLPTGSQVNVSNNPYIPTDNNIPPAPDPKLTASKAKHEQASLYRSRFNGEFPEDRLRKSKSKSTKLKKDSSGVMLGVREDVITIKEEKPFLNSSKEGQVLEGFDDLQFQDKQFKKFSITALVKERELIKESNYFDESHDGDEQVRPVVEKSQADFRIGGLEAFQTFQIKTYLFDRNLSKKIVN